MAYIITNDQHYKDIATAIRNKDGTDNPYTPPEMPGAIDRIPQTFPPGHELPPLSNPASALDLLIGKEAYASDCSVISGTLKMRHGTALLEKDLKGMTLQLIQHNLGVTPNLFFVTKTADADATRVSNVLWGMQYAVFGTQPVSGSVFSVKDASGVQSVQISSSNRVAMLVNENSFQLGMLDSKYSWAGGETVEWWVFKI